MSAKDNLSFILSDIYTHRQSSVSFDDMLMMLLFKCHLCYTQQHSEHIIDALQQTRLRISEISVTVFLPARIDISAQCLHL